MLDKSKIGYEFQSFTTDIEKGRLKFFAKAIGETDPIYSDEDAAKSAGYKTIPAPPTFMFSIDLDGPVFLPMLKVLKMDIGRILHGTQDFQYFGQIYAGDKITQTAKISNVMQQA